MQPLWRFINTGLGSAAGNMALDEALLLLHEAHTAPPTLRVYGWYQPTLSLGYAQNARQEVDLAACQAQGVAVVRRPTGGRAVHVERRLFASRDPRRCADDVPSSD